MSMRKRTSDAAGAGGKPEWMVDVVENLAGEGDERVALGNTWPYSIFAQDQWEPWNREEQYLLAKARTLEAALEYCRLHVREELDRVALLGREPISGADLYDRYCSSADDPFIVAKHERWHRGEPGPFNGQEYAEQVCRERLGDWRPAHVRLAERRALKAKLEATEAQGPKWS